MVGRLASPSYLSLAQFSIDCRHKTAQIALANVVVGTVNHGLDPYVIAYCARYEDKRDIQVPFLIQVKRCGTAEAWHRVVCDDNIPLLFVKCVEHVFLGVNAFKDGDITTPLELTHHKERIVLGILDNQDLKGLPHVLLSSSRRGFIQNQPIEPQLSDSLDEVAEIYGFPDVAVCTKTITINKILLFLRRCKDYNGNKFRALVRAQPLQYLDATDPGKLQIEENEHGQRASIVIFAFPCTEETVESLSAIPCNNNIITDIVLLQCTKGKGYVIGIIFNQENCLFLHYCYLSKFIPSSFTR
ncbi:MAG: hypothetical protein A4E62_03078 [Syntrophorhabdus sp. PtaU1.Bin002]|nr:MAG: hypothetical protein A4E62_03078 [Syntrophorhabdus sp. PtaU1.Bin002]